MNILTLLLTEKSFDFIGGNDVQVLFDFYRKSFFIFFLKWVGTHLFDLFKIQFLLFLSGPFGFKFIQGNLQSIFANPFQKIITTMQFEAA